MENDVLVRPSGTTAARVRLAHCVYALYSLTILIGILGQTTKLAPWVAAWPSVLGLSISLINRGAVRGTFLSSHFRWQIRTFWIVPFLTILLFISTLPKQELGLLFLGGPIAFTALFFAYRVGKGWLTLTDRRRMYESYRVT